MKRWVSSQTFVSAMQHLGLLPKKANGNGIGMAAQESFCRTFGITPAACVVIWHRSKRNPKMKPKHLLWGLLQMKLYSTEQILSNMAKTNRTTYQKWSMIAITMIARLAPQFVSNSFSHT